MRIRTSCYAGDSGVRVVKQCGEERVEAVGVGVDVGVGFGEFEAGAPEFLGLRHPLVSWVAVVRWEMGGHVQRR